TGQSCCADRQVRPESCSTTDGHRLGDFRANSSVFFNQIMRNRQQLSFELIVVSDNAAAKPGARSCDTAETMSYQSRGNAFRRRQRGAMFAEEPHNLIMQVLFLDTKHQIAEPLSDRPLDGLDLRERLDLVRSAGQNAQGDGRIADRDADLGHMSAFG